jgi:hypothetical protein
VKQQKWGEATEMASYSYRDLCDKVIIFIKRSKRVMGQDAKNAGRVESNSIGKGRARRKGEYVGEEELAGRPNHTCLIKLSYTDPPVGGAALHSEVKKGRMVGTSLLAWLWGSLRFFLFC